MEETTEAKVEQPKDLVVEIKETLKTGERIG